MTYTLITDVGNFQVEQTASLSSASRDIDKEWTFQFFPHLPLPGEVEAFCSISVGGRGLPWEEALKWAVNLRLLGAS